MFVLDASVTMSWCFSDEAGPYTDSVLDRLRGMEAMVPTIWPLEIANILVVGERRQRLTEAQTTRFNALLQSLPITVDAGAIDRALGSILELARTHNLSVYDAAYIDLAMMRGLPLATTDTRLSEAATRCGVPLVE